MSTPLSALESGRKRGSSSAKCGVAESILGCAIPNVGRDALSRLRLWHRSTARPRPPGSHRCVAAGPSYQDDKVELVGKLVEERIEFGWRLLGPFCDFGQCLRSGHGWLAQFRANVRCKLSKMQRRFRRQVIAGEKFAGRFRAGHLESIRRIRRPN